MSGPAQTNRSVLDMMDSFLKKAEELSKEAGNLDLASDAKSTHPSANVDDGTQKANEGARSSENESDVRKDTPNTINDESANNTAGGSKKPTDTQGTVSMASDDPLKGNVDTPKDNHSQSMSDKGPGDNTFSGTGDKSAAASALAAEANRLLAELAMIGKQAAAPAQAAPAAPAAQPPVEGQDKQAAETKEAMEKAAALFKEAAEKYPEDVEAGYVAAALLAHELGMLKDAGAADVYTETVAAIQKQAADDAQMYVDFLKGFTEKSAEGMEGMEGMGGGLPPELAMLAGGGGGAEGGMPPEGAMPPEGELQGDEGAAGLAGEGEGGGGELGAEGGNEDVLEALVQALDEAGATPEDLAAALAEAQGGGEGGGEGDVAAAMGGGGAPVGEVGAEEAGKSASAGASGATKKAAAGSNKNQLKEKLTAFFAKR